VGVKSEGERELVKPILGCSVYEIIHWWLVGASASVVLFWILAGICATLRSTLCTTQMLQAIVDDVRGRITESRGNKRCEIPLDVVTAQLKPRLNPSFEAMLASALVEVAFYIHLKGTDDHLAARLRDVAKAPSFNNHEMLIQLLDTIPDANLCEGGFTPYFGHRVVPFRVHRCRLWNALQLRQEDLVPSPSSTPSSFSAASLTSLTPEQLLTNTVHEHVTKRYEAARLVARQRDAARNTGSEERTDGPTPTWIDIFKQVQATFSFDDNASTTGLLEAVLRASDPWTKTGRLRRNFWWLDDVAQEAQMKVFCRTMWILMSVTAEYQQCVDEEKLIPAVLSSAPSAVAATATTSVGFAKSEDRRAAGQFVLGAASLLAQHTPTFLDAHDGLDAWVQLLPTDWLLQANDEALSHKFGTLFGINRKVRRELTARRLVVRARKQEQQRLSSSSGNSPPPPAANEQFSRYAIAFLMQLSRPKGPSFATRATTTTLKEQKEEEEEEEEAKSVNTKKRSRPVVTKPTASATVQETIMADVNADAQEEEDEVAKEDEEEGEEAAQPAPSKRANNTQCCDSPAGCRQVAVYKATANTVWTYPKLLCANCIKPLMDLHKKTYIAI